MKSNPLDPESHGPSIPMGRRARKAIAVRLALFRAGLNAFERQPIGLVSVLDITEAADVAKGVFYLHFRSKDEYLLSLWEDVQNTFLQHICDSVEGRRSRTARVEAIVGAYHRLSEDSPASARFWIRMSGYFPDEVGEPGRLTRLHSAYQTQLATVLTGGGAVDAAALHAARLLDATCWALLRSCMNTGAPVYDANTIVRVVQAITRILPRSIESPQ